MLDIGNHWYQHQISKRDEEGPKPTAFDTPFRVSSAGSCIRQRTFNAFQAMESDELSPQSLMAFEVGNSMHSSIQESLNTDGNGWSFVEEVPIDLTETSKMVGHGIESFGLSGHCDGIITNDDDTRTILEIKTVSSYQAKLSWTPGPPHFKTLGHGPKREHWAQAALYALGTDADSVLIVYISKEGDFRTGIKAGAVCQWERGLYEVDEDTGLSLYDLALEELRHFQYAARYYAKGQIAPAFVPDDDGKLHLMHERPEYMAKQGEWRCRYCNYNTTCRSLSEDEVPVEMIERIKQ